MATVAAIAQRVLDENRYTTKDCGSLTILEYMIDNAIDYVNGMAGTSIADLSGTAESKSITGSDTEILVVKMISALMIRARVDRGPSSNMGGISIAPVLADPQYNLTMKIINGMINNLRGRSFTRT